MVSTPLPVGTKHRIGNKQTAVQMLDGSFAEQNYSVGSNKITASEVAVTTTSAELAPANAGRVSMLISNTGSATVYLGPTGVATTNGYPLAANESLKLETCAAVHAVAASGTVNVRLLSLIN